MKLFRSVGGVLALSMLMLGCGGIASDAEDDNATGMLIQGLSDVAGCHFYVGSNYGGYTLHMQRGTTIANLYSKNMTDKISSVRLRGGASTKMWIDDNYRGASWYIVNDVATFHTSSWGNLGDNSSSIDCY